MTDIISTRDDSRDIPDDVRDTIEADGTTMTMRRTLLTLARLFAFCLTLIAVAEGMQAYFGIAMPSTLGTASNAAGILIGAVLTAAGIEHYSRKGGTK